VEKLGCGIVSQKRFGKKAIGDRGEILHYWVVGLRLGLYFFEFEDTLISKLNVEL